ncbi:MAG: prefoldin subunit alpha [Candidatus Thorarchaeota archaeon]
MTENPFQQLINEQRELEERAAELEASMGMFQDTLGSYMAGLGVIEELETKEPGEKMLINVGGAIFIEAQVTSNDRVIRGIGSGVRVEQSLDEAKKILSERIEEIKGHLTGIRQEYENTAGRAAFLANQAQQILAQAQAAQNAQLAQQSEPEE